MIHYSTKYRPQSDHYAVGISSWSNELNLPKYVLAQIMEDGNQARIALTVEEAKHFAELLLQAAEKITK